MTGGPTAAVTTLPAALEPWEPELRHFSAGLAGQLSALSQPLYHALGAFHRRAELPSDEPVGYGAVSRRGAYERLLVSEWALQLEDPDEFIRRASSGEHLFVELERRTQSVSEEAWLLLDTGPSQLGAPRLGQLAALVAFTRRAREAGLFLRWAPLWSFEAPEHRALTPQTVQAWLEARTATEPTPGLLTQWSSQWTETTVRRDVWVVGGRGASALAREQGWNAIAIEETRDEGTPGLWVEVQPTRRRPTALRLELPNPAAVVKVLRNPFEWRAPSPPRREHGPIELHPSSELVFSEDSRRLLVRTADGGVVALPVRNTARATYGWPLEAHLPPRTSLVAVSWLSRKDKRLIVFDEASGVAYEADWNGVARRERVLAKQPVRPAPHELFTSAWPHAHGWVARGRWFDGAADRLDPQVLAARVDRRSLLLARPGAPSPIRAVSAGVTSFHTPEGARQVVLSGDGSPKALCRYDEVLRLHLVDRVPLEFPAEELAQRELVGFMMGGPEGTFLAVDADGQGLGRVQLGAPGRVLEQSPAGDPQARVPFHWETVTRARAKVTACAVSPNGEYAAWRDVTGELAVYALTRGEVVLRVHMTDALKELV